MLKGCKKDNFTIFKNSNNNFGGWQKAKFTKINKRLSLEKETFFFFVLCPPASICNLAKALRQKKKADRGRRGNKKKDADQLVDMIGVKCAIESIIFIILIFDSSIASVVAL